MIQTKVEDETGSTTFILFDRGAEKIISNTAKELAEVKEKVIKIYKLYICVMKQQH